MKSLNLNSQLDFSVLFLMDTDFNVLKYVKNNFNILILMYF